MPKLTIDNREITVPAGTKLIDAAAELGIMIPRFCYHPALGSVGACRVCAVKVLSGPPHLTRGVQMSCMVDAQEGMVISTTDPEAVDFRRHIIEFLMLNHPHDCPVCDEGGHCLLQDMTVSGGHGLRRYKGPKRTHSDQDLGPLLQHEMNRCIQCYRCTRFYREFTGYTDLGVMGIGARVYFGRTRPGTLESPFSGNLADICPTGVYTDKPSRYKGRRWDFERKPSICIHCSLGCGTVVCSRYREVVRQEARLNPAVNGHFICDRGRYGFAYTNAPDRPRHARVEGDAVDLERALTEAHRRLSTGRTAVVGGLRSSLETQALLTDLSRRAGWQPPAFWVDRDQAESALAAFSASAGGGAVSLPGVAAADAIVILGADPVNEAPMMVPAIRQAWRRGASVGVIDPRPVSLPLTARHCPAGPNALPLAAGALLAGVLPAERIAGLSRQLRELVTAGADSPFAENEAIADMAAALTQSRRPVLICGTDLADALLPAVAGEMARALDGAERTGAVSFLLPGAGAYGAALLSGESGRSAGEVVAAIEAGEIDALVAVESDLFALYPDRARLEAALARLRLLVALDCCRTPLYEQADIAIPTASVYEAGGIFVNHAGRALPASPALRAGIPAVQADGGGHPARTFRADVPGGELHSPWRLLMRMGRMTEELREIWPRLSPALAVLGNGELLPAAGCSLSPHDPPERPVPAWRPADADPDQLHLLLVERTFGTEPLSAASPPLQDLAGAPEATLNPRDGEALGISAGDTVAIAISESAGITVRARLDAAAAPGVLILPRHHRLFWQRVAARRTRISRSAIKRESGQGTG